MEPINMDRSIARDFQVIAHHIGEQMYADLMLSFQLSTSFQYLAIVAAVYLLIIDCSHWRTNVRLTLLVPYIAFNLPDFILGYTRSEIGAWIAFFALVIRLFFPTHIPQHSELPISLILLLVTAPGLLIKCRFEWPGEIVSIGIAFYLLYEHMIKVGGFKKAFAKPGAVITIDIVLLIVAPVQQLILEGSLFQLVYAESFLYIMLGLTVIASPLLLLFALPASQPGEHKE